MIKQNKTNGPESLCLGIPIVHYCYYVTKIVFSQELLVFGCITSSSHFTRSKKCARHGPDGMEGAYEDTREL